MDKRGIGTLSFVRASSEPVMLLHFTLHRRAVRGPLTMPGSGSTWIGTVIGKECVKQHIVKILKAFYQEFPDARKLPDRRRSSQGMGFGSTAEPAELEDFPCDSD